MATLSFYGGGGPYAINNLGGSGLGFYGSSFGSSVVVGEWNNTVFITNGAGNIEGAQVNSCQYLNSMSGSINGAAGILLTQIPNYLATLNIRFTNPSPVKLQNSKIRIYDRDNINNDPSGVIVKIARIIHSDVAQTNTGSGDTAWQTPHGSSVVMSLDGSPGYSGLSPAGPNTESSQHDFFAVLALSPENIGSKTQVGLYFSCEYL